MTFHLIIDCGTPPNPPNTEAVSGYPRTYGSAKTYQCQHSFEASGFMIIFCMANGWSNVLFTCS